MKQIRWWNSFNLLGAILILISLGGLLSGGKMVFDPGRKAKGYEWALYLGAGVLMLVNGMLPPSTVSQKNKN
jgi:hypothetical protein